MVRMSAGEKKKKLIMDTCKELFYEKGYMETTFADIAEKADIPQGLITYHFESKLNIGLLIRAEFEREDYDYTHALLAPLGADYKTRTVVGLLHYWKLLFADAKLRRFLVEIMTSGFADMDRIEETKRYYRPIMNECGVTDIDHGRFGLIAAAHVGMELELLGYVARGLDAYTYEDIALFFIERRFEMIGVPKEVYQEAVETGKEIFPQIPYDYRFYKGFKFDKKYIKTPKLKIPAGAE